VVSQPREDGPLPSNILLSQDEESSGLPMTTRCHKAAGFWSRPDLLPKREKGARGPRNWGLRGGDHLLRFGLRTTPLRMLQAPSETDGAGRYHHSFPAPFNQPVDLPGLIGVNAESLRHPSVP
jgi:hypothetical protein